VPYVPMCFKKKEKYVESIQSKHTKKWKKYNPPTFGNTSPTAF
jgi:hypothetical protein